MKKYTKIQTVKVDTETDIFLKSISLKSKFIRDAIQEKRQRDNLIKKDKRKKATIKDLKNALNSCFLINKS